MPLSQRLLGAGKAAELPASELPPAEATASRADPAAGGNGAAVDAAGRRVPLCQMPGPLDPPRRGPHADPLPLCGGLSSQVCGAIAGAQILPVCEGGAAAHHCQVDVLAIAEHLGHGAAAGLGFIGGLSQGKPCRAPGSSAEPVAAEAFGVLHGQGPVTCPREAGAAAGLEVVVAVGDPLQQQLRRQGVARQLLGASERVPLTLQDQCRRPQLLQVFGSLPFRLAGRVEGVARLIPPRTVSPRTSPAAEPPRDNASSRKLANRPPSDLPQRTSS